MQKQFVAIGVPKTQLIKQTKCVRQMYGQKKLHLA